MKLKKITDKLLIAIILTFVIVALVLTFIKEKTGSLEILDQSSGKEIKHANYGMYEIDLKGIMPENNIEGLYYPLSKATEETIEKEKEAKEEQVAQEASTNSTTNNTTTSIAQRSFRLNSGRYVKGQYILNIVKGNPNGLKLWNAFNSEFGATVADTAAISLYYENGTLKTDTVGVCNPIHQIGGDYRNCAYADMNSAGMDVGLKQINTFYQAKRITKLGGEPCTFRDSKDRNDPCNQKKIAWLFNVDNNIKIALDIYREQGFRPWYGYRRAFN
jgi:hypothetical protein